MKDLESNLEKILQPDHNSSQNVFNIEEQTLTGITPIETGDPTFSVPAPVDEPATGAEEFFSLPSEPNRNLEEVIGVPGGQSTPVPSPERPKTTEVDSVPKPAPDRQRKMSRFEIQKVCEDIRESVEAERHHNISLQPG